MHDVETFGYMAWTDRWTNERTYNLDKLEVGALSNNI